MTKYTTLSDELNKLPRKRQEFIEARASQIHLEEITNTYAQINQTYQEIKSTDGFNFQLPSMGISLLVGLSAIALIGFFKKLSSGENNNEI
ncbi:MAG: hypothetical protein ACKO11_06075 [Cuspidothrix sp.]